MIYDLMLIDSRFVHDDLTSINILVFWTWYWWQRFFTWGWQCIWATSISMVNICWPSLQVGSLPGVLLTPLLQGQQKPQLPIYIRPLIGVIKKNSSQKNRDGAHLVTVWWLILQVASLQSPLQHPDEEWQDIGPGRFKSWTRGPRLCFQISHLHNPHICLATKHFSWARKGWRRQKPTFVAWLRRAWAWCFKRLIDLIGWLWRGFVWSGRPRCWPAASIHTFGPRSSQRDPWPWEISGGFAVVEPLCILIEVCRILSGKG